MVDERAKGTLKTYFLTRSYPQALQPFMSIMDLPAEHANTLTAQFTGKSSDTGNYFSDRETVESWLRQEAQKAGIQIKDPHPIYFRLTERPENDTSEDLHFHSISLPIADIDLATCSFTVGDSFGHYAVAADHKLGGSRASKLLNHADPEAILNGYQSVKDKQDNYIEVQMWDRPRI